MMSERFQKAQPSLKRLPFGVLLWVIARVFISRVHPWMLFRTVATTREKYFSFQIKALVAITG